MTVESRYFFFSPSFTNGGHKRIAYGYCRHKMFQTKLKLTARPERDRSPFRPAANSALLIPFSVFPAPAMKPRSRRKLVFLLHQRRNTFRSHPPLKKKKGKREQGKGRKTAGTIDNMISRGKKSPFPEIKLIRVEEKDFDEFL